MSKYEQERAKAKKKVAGQLEDLQQEVRALRDIEKQYQEEIRILRMQNGTLQKENENMHTALSANLSEETLKIIIKMDSLRDALKHFGM